MLFGKTFGLGKSRFARIRGPRRGRPDARLACEMLEARCLLSYAIADLGGLPQVFPVDQAYAINNQGQVAGRSNLPAGSRPVLWDNGAMTQLGTLSGTAYAIDDQSQVVGGISVAGTVHAFLWQAGVLTDLGTPIGSGDSQAQGINNAGQIVVSTGFGNHAYLWQAGVWTNLGTLGGSWSNPRGINDQGQIVGTSYTAAGAIHAFLWQGGTMSDLGTLGGYSAAVAINNQSQVVGSYLVSGDSGPRHAFLWDNGVMTDLGTLGGSYSEADGINDQGQIVGWSTTESEAEHAVLWDHGTMIDLGVPPGFQIGAAFGINEEGQVLVSTVSDSGTFLWQDGAWTALGGAVDGYSSSFAIDINSQRQVVGYSYLTPTIRHAVLWDNGMPTDLGTLGGSISFAWAINDQGQVVGSSTTTSGAYHTFLWQNGVMTDLGTLGGSESYAYGINDQGQVVGTSASATGFSHAFVWDSGLMTDLGTLGGVSDAAGINNAAQIVGSSALSAGGPIHGFLWDGVNGMQDLGTLAGDSRSSAFGINDVGQAIGVSGATVSYTDAYFDPESGDCFPFQSVADFPHAVLWYNGTPMTIGTLAGTNGGQAMAVNNVGQVIGYSFSSALVPNADCPGTVHYAASGYYWFLWQDGVTTDLGAMLPPGSGWTIQSVTGINDAGEIVGYGRNPEGQTHAFLLTPGAGPSPHRGFQAESLAQLAFPYDIPIGTPTRAISADPQVVSMPFRQSMDLLAGQIASSEANAMARVAFSSDRIFTASDSLAKSAESVLVDLAAETVLRSLA